MKKISKLCIAIFIITMLSSCNADKQVQDNSFYLESIPETTEEIIIDDYWKFSTPEEQGMSSNKLAALHDEIRDIEITSAITVRNGVVVDEYYKDGFDKNSVFRLASCTKSFSSALIGIAIEQGLIENVDVKISTFFPEINTDTDDRKKDITIRHLLEHTSGILWQESYGGTMFRQFTQSEIWVDFVITQQMEAAPGTVFSYSTGGSHLLAAIIQKVTGKTAFEYAKENMFKAMKMTSVEWRADPQGITDGGNGISMTPLDAAKFGQLYLQNGKWEGVQIIPEHWVSESVMTHANGQPGSYGKYGYQWWIKKFGGYDAYYANGHGGQYIVAVPSLNLVAVLTSRLGQDGTVPQKYISEYVIAACN